MCQTNTTYQKGDIILVDLEPSIGHEKGKYRPALVMNEQKLKGGITFILPITSVNHDEALDVKLDERTHTKGYVECFQLRSVDVFSRATRKVDKAPDDIVEQCAEKVKEIMG